MTVPEIGQIEFAARSAQRDMIVRLFEQAGYASDEPFNTPEMNRRLHLSGAKRKLNIDVFFDVLELDHRLDLTPFLNQEGNVVSETALVLIGLQTVEMTDTLLNETCALLLEYDLSLESKAGQISESWIIEYCLKDKDLAQTVLKNLALLASHASTALALPDQAVVVERVRRLTQSINVGLLMIASRSSSNWR